MKAIVCNELGPAENLRYQEVADPTPEPEEMLVTVKAAGVNFLDTLIVQGQYQEKPALPFSPGGELAGVVKICGAGVTQFKPGDRVAAFVSYGAYAEQATLKPSNACLLPDSIDDPTAASLLVTYGTGIHAFVQRAQLQAGETVLVLGAAGGVGLAAVQIAKAMGARVIAAASDQTKLDLASANGADALVNYATDNLRDAVKALTNGAGADVIYDPVGGDLFDQCTRCIAWNGRLLVVGFASGRIPQLPVNLTLVKGMAVVGVFWGRATQEDPATHQANMAQLFQWHAEGLIKPHIDEILPLSEAVRALHKIANREVRGKLILTP